MPIFLVDQTEDVSAEERVVISADHFGGNILLHHAGDAAFDTSGKLQDLSDTNLLNDQAQLREDIVALIVQNMRFPGGTVTEEFFDIFNPNATSGEFKGETRQLVGMDDFFDMAAEVFSQMQNVDPAVTFVIPTRAGFTESALGALLAGTYGTRTVDLSYVERAADFAVEAILAAQHRNVKISTFEIGNEFWLGAEMTATEYGAIASQIALAVDRALDSMGLDDGDRPDIVVQSVTSAGRMSPKEDFTLFYDTHGNLYENSDASDDIVGSVVVPGQGNSRDQLADLIDQFSVEALDVINGVVAHYYSEVGFDGVDDRAQYIFNQFEFWENRANEISLAAGHEAISLDTYVTEWNTESGNHPNNEGLQQASMLVEMFYEMVTHGVDAAHVWPLAHRMSQGTSLTDRRGGEGLSLAGESFRMMSESLVGLAAQFEWEGEGLDIHGFGDAGRMVLFASNRSDAAFEGTVLDISGLGLAGAEYFVTSQSLGDGEANGRDGNAEPVLSFEEGRMVSDGLLTLGAMDGWGLTKIEIVAVTRGNDTVQGFESNDLIKTLNGEDVVFGGKGDDTIIGGSNNDTLHGGEGDDLVEGGNGRDRVFLEDGNDEFLDNAQTGFYGHDTVFAGQGNDTIRGGGSGDRFYGQAGDDSLSGGEGNDTVFGGANHDVIDGGEGEDRLLGGNGNDTVQGGAGNDMIFGGKNFDEIDGNEGDDRIWGGDHADVILGGEGNDTLFGGNGRDTLLGGNDADLILGGSGADQLFGESGNDTLEGAGGNDALYGGLGADTFVFAQQFGQDTVYGFDEADVLDFSRNADINDLENLLENHVFQINEDVVISVDAMNEILILDVDLQDLAASEHFLF